VAANIGDGLGVNVVVENRAGAATIVGAELVARSAPDGYTLFLTTGTAVSINQHMYKSLPYNPEKDFAPVGRLASNPYVMFARAGMPFNTMADMFAYAKANPGKLNVALPGAGTPTHLALQMLENASGAKFTAVQYKGNAPALNDLLGERIEMMLSSPLIMFAHVKSGKLKAIATAAPRRMPQFPDAPAFAEMFPGFEAQTWFGIVTRAGTPRDAITRVNAEMQKFVKDQATRDKLGALGMVLDGGTPEQMAAYIREESDRWGKVIKQMGLKLE
jgi:tripartite-type tricarboxylate transporter receptor subunit TctC